MADMTDKEYDTLDELWTKTTPKVNFERPGVFASQRILLESLDSLSVSCIQSPSSSPKQALTAAPK